MNPLVRGSRAKRSPSFSAPSLSGPGKCWYGLSGGCRSGSPVTGPALIECRRRWQLREGAVVDQHALLARTGPPTPGPEALQQIPSASPWPKDLAARCRRVPLSRGSTSTARHGSARRQRREHRRRTRPHTAGPCRVRSNRPRLGLPRRRSSHPLAHGTGILPIRPLTGRQRCIRQELLGKGKRRPGRMAAELVGHPPRKGHVEALDNGYHVVWDAYRLVWHVCMYVTYIRTECQVHPARAMGRSKHSTRPGFAIDELLLDQRCRRR